MPGFTAKDVQRLRQGAGVGMMDAKKALVEADGDMDRAHDLLRERGLAKAAKRAGRDAGEGTIGNYLHHQSGHPVMGVLVELACETDFVAKSPEFNEVANDIALHVSWAAPRWIAREEVPEDVLAHERDLIARAARAEGKPDRIIPRIVGGRMEKFYTENVLSDQVFVNSQKFEGTVGEMVTGLAAKMGENVKVCRVARVAVGERGLVMTATRRVLLKLSGEAFCEREGGFGIDPSRVADFAAEISRARKDGAEISVVVGGGNFFRGTALAARGLDPATADYMGMLATVMNGLALRDALEKCGTTTRVMSAITMRQVSEPYIRLRAVRHLEKGRVVVFVAGTGNPFFTTDTTAALRAIETGAGVLLKASKVDGVYSADPNLDSSARLLESASYMHVIAEELKVMDMTAITLCREHELPIVVFDMTKPGNVYRALMGEPLGTRVSRGAK